MTQYFGTPPTQAQQWFTILPVAVRSAATSSADFTKPDNVRGLLVIVSIIAAPGVDTVNAGIAMRDPLSGALSDLFQLGARTAPGNYSMMIYPGGNDVAGAISGKTFIPLPSQWRFRTYHSAATDFTYGVTGIYLP